MTSEILIGVVQSMVLGREVHIDSIELRIRRAALKASKVDEPGIGISEKLERRYRAEAATDRVFRIVTKGI